MKTPALASHGFASKPLWQLLVLACALFIAIRAVARCAAIEDNRYDALATDPGLRAGDIVFIHVGGPIFSRVAATSNGWVSHVGILVGQRGGVWWVAESRVPRSSETPLADFLARSSTGQFAIKRLRTRVDEAEAARLNAAVRRRLGVRYDLGFNFDSARTTFCSKFVYEVVRESTGEPLGDLETFRTLMARNPQAPVRFWKTWFFGHIPWSRRTVTPESQYESPRLVTVREHT